MLICQSQPLLSAFLGFYGEEEVGLFLLDILALGRCLPGWALALTGDAGFLHGVPIWGTGAAEIRQ